jgi:hypothetical protein
MKAGGEVVMAGVKGNVGKNNEKVYMAGEREPIKRKERSIMAN